MPGVDHCFTKRIKRKAYETRKHVFHLECNMGYMLMILPNCLVPVTHWVRQTYMPIWNELSSVQVMARSLFDSRCSSIQMLYCQLHSRKIRQCYLNYKATIVIKYKHLKMSAKYQPLCPGHWVNSCTGPIPLRVWSIEMSKRRQDITSLFPSDLTAMRRPFSRVFGLSSVFHTGKK